MHLNSCEKFSPQPRRSRSNKKRGPCGRAIFRCYSTFPCPWDIVKSTKVDTSLSTASFRWHSTGAPQSPKNQQQDGDGSSKSDEMTPAVMPALPPHQGVTHLKYTADSSPPPCVTSSFKM